MRDDAYDKIWDLNKISLGRQPQTESDAAELNESYRSISESLQDQIRISERKETVTNLRDGELVVVS